MDEQGMITALRILFDGKPEHEIAKVLVEALRDRAMPLRWRLTELLPFADMYTVDDVTIHDWLSFDGKAWIGTGEDMRELLHWLANQSSDYANDAMYDFCRDAVFDYLKEPHNTHLVTAETECRPTTGNLGGNYAEIQGTTD